MVLSCQEVAVVKPFEFSVSASMAVPSPAAWLDSIRRVEDLGFSAIVMPDHFTGGYALEPMVALTAAAGATTTLRLQTGVLGNDYRHPVLTARMAASLDVLSGGRLILGMGAGWMTSDYEAAGIPLDSAGVRLRRLEESVRVVRGLMSGAHFVFHGDFFDIDLELLPRTVQEPVPVLVGGGGPRMLRLAGRLGDIVSIVADLGAGHLGPHTITDLAAERVVEKVSWIREGAAEEGRPLDQITIGMNHWLVRVTRTIDEGRAFLEKMAGQSGVPIDVLDASPAVLVGTLGQVVEQIQTSRERLGVSFVHLDAGFAPKDVGALAPIVAQLAGT